MNIIYLLPSEKTVSKKVNSFNFTLWLAPLQIENVKVDLKLKSKTEKKGFLKQKKWKTNPWWSNCYTPMIDLKVGGLRVQSD